MTFFLWSKTAASNSTADTTINWAEGQAPSTVNDSGRAMMAAAAKFRDDISGTITTGGTSTAYTLTTNQVFTSLAAMDGKMVTFIPHATCGAAPTLAVDGLAAKAIVTAGGIAVIGAGDLAQGTVHSAVYNNSLGQFVLIGPYDALIAPTGTVMLFQQTAAPTGWTKSVTHNDKALRIVSGTAGTGGSTAFSTIFASRTIAQANLPSYVLPNTLGVSVLANVTGMSAAAVAAATGITASFGGAFSNSYNAGGITGYLNAGGPTAVTVNDPTHTHTINLTDPTHAHTASVTGSVTSGGSNTGMDFAVLYVDCILATKN